MTRIKKTIGDLDLTILILLAFILVFRLLWILPVPPHALATDAAFYDKVANWFRETGTFSSNQILSPSA